MYKFREVEPSGDEQPSSVNEIEKAVTKARVSVGIRHQIVNGGGGLLDSQMASIVVAFQFDEQLHQAIRARGRIRLQKPR